MEPANDSLGSAIWQAMTEDPIMVAQLPPEGPARDMWRELAFSLPTILAAHLDRPVSLENIMRTQRTMLAHMVETHFIVRLAEQMGGMTASMGEMMEGMLGSLLSMLDGIVDNVPGFLEGQGITEEQVLCHPKGSGFTPVTLQRWRTGELTIRELLTLQPSVIIVSNRD